MNAAVDPFYFDKTDLFKKIKNIESVLGLGSFNVEEVVLRLAPTDFLSGTGNIPAIYLVE